MLHSHLIPQSRLLHKLAKFIIFKMISINNLTKSFGRENLFDDLSLTIHPNTRIALVGKNGAGKTTFLRCLIGQENFDGRIISEETKISLMEQEQNFDHLHKTFNEYMNDKKEELEHKKAALEEELQNPDIYEDEKKFNHIIDSINLILADTSFKLETKKIIEILSKLNINESVLNQKISELSGGQKIKLRLAECLAKKADLYLLDEPTNHLDLETLEWIEDYIEENVKSLIVISHDKYFLNKVVDQIWEIEDQKIKQYTCNYADYEENKIKHMNVLKKQHKDATKKKKELLESAKEKRRWAGISGSSKLRVIAERLERDAENVVIGPNPDDFITEIKMNFTNKVLHNCELFIINGLMKKFEDITLFEHVNQEIDQGEKIAIIGGNGTGKTTFLKMLMGTEKISEGTIKKRKDLEIGYFDQELEGINQNQTLMDYLKTETPRKESFLKATLKKFNFTKDTFIQQVKNLSGGEKGRLNLLRITTEQNEVLLLDEPTNNLDIYIMDSLEKAIKKFPGTVIFVSHNRDFIDKVATRVLEIKDKEIKGYNGNYSDYLDMKKRIGN